MHSRNRWILCGIVVLALSLIGVAVARQSGDPVVEACLDREYTRTSAIESEVVEAEVATWGDRQFRYLAEELAREGGLRKRFRTWLWNHVPLLRDELNPIAGASMERQGRILRILTAAGPRARVAEPAVQALISDPSSESLDAALLAMARLRGDSPAALQELVGQTISGAARDLRRIAPLWSSEVTDPPAELIPFLIQLLGSRQEQERAAAARSLAMFGRRAAVAAGPLRELLADRSRIVRPRAALALGMVAPEFAREAVTVMLEQQRTNNAWTGDMAHRLYFEAGAAAVDAVPRLNAELSRPADRLMHGAAAAALWRIDRQVTRERIEALAWDAENGLQRTQLRSLLVLGEMGSNASPAIPVLQRLRRHPLRLVRQRAEAVLQQLAGAR